MGKWIYRIPFLGPARRRAYEKKRREQIADNKEFFALRVYDLTAISARVDADVARARRMPQEFIDLYERWANDATAKGEALRDQARRLREGTLSLADIGAS